MAAYEIILMRNTSVFQASFDDGSSASWGASAEPDLQSCRRLGSFGHQPRFPAPGGPSNVGSFWGWYGSLGHNVYCGTPI